MINIVVIALETDESVDEENGHKNSNLYHNLDLFFLSVYLFEFIAKVYVFPISYWKQGYNRFDFFVLLISLLQWILGFTSIALTSPEFVRVLKGNPYPIMSTEAKSQPCVHSEPFERFHSFEPCRSSYPL